MKNKATLLALTAALTLQACSSRPRQFSPVLQAAPADAAAFDASYRECHALAADGKLKSDALASGGGGAAAGAATGAAGAAIATGSAGWGGFAVMGATLVLAPFAIAAGAWGVAKSKKTKKEKAIQSAAASCLQQNGYEVVGWELASRSEAVPADPR